MTLVKHKRQSQGHDPDQCQAQTSQVFPQEPFVNSHGIFLLQATGRNSLPITRLGSAPVVAFAPNEPPRRVIRATTAVSARHSLLQGILKQGPELLDGNHFIMSSRQVVGPFPHVMFPPWHLPNIP
jgi:hypothetical protein